MPHTCHVPHTCHIFLPVPLGKRGTWQRCCLTARTRRYVRHTKLCFVKTQALAKPFLPNPPKGVVFAEAKPDGARKTYSPQKKGDCTWGWAYKASLCNAYIGTARLRTYVRTKRSFVCEALSAKLCMRSFVCEALYAKLCMRSFVWGYHCFS